jgi:secernin
MPIDLDAAQPLPFAQSCDTMVALSDRTGGGVLLAKNSDRLPDEAQRLIGIAAADHPAGAQVRCQYLSVPQAQHTAALIGSQPYWLWGFEHGLNEHGVAIGNEAIFTREQPAEVGLLGMDLVRLGLERGTTAHQALDAITELLERFGQGGSTVFAGRQFYDNSFLIADPGEAWVLETAGRHWAARRLTSGAYAISNRPTLGTDYDRSSPDLVTYAEERGWWPRGRRPFHFAEAYTDPDYRGLPAAECRLLRSRSRLAVGEQAALTVATLIELLRDHGANPVGGAAPLDWPTGQERATICMHGRSEGIATAASMVAELTPGVVPRYWASMAPPCTGIFLPCWVDTGPPEILAKAEGTAITDSPWRRFRRLWETVAGSNDPGTLVGEIRTAWKAVESRIAEQSALRDSTASPAARRELSEWACREALRTLGRIETQLGISVE